MNFKTGLSPEITKGVKMKALVCILALFVALPALASVRFFDNSGQDLGAHADVKCGYGTTCSQISGKMYVNQQSQTESLVATEFVAATDCGKTYVQGVATSITVKLPEASTVPGCELSFVSQYQGNFIVDPYDGTDSIVGLSINAAGDSVISTQPGNNLTLRAIREDYWAVISGGSGFTDNN